MVFPLPPAACMSIDCSSCRARGVCSTSCQPAISTAIRGRKQAVTRQLCRAEERQSLSYKTAGVDIDAGNEVVRRIQKLNPQIGGFSGLVPFGAH